VHLAVTRGQPLVRSSRPFSGVSCPWTLLAQPDEHAAGSLVIANPRRDEPYPGAAWTPGGSRGHDPTDGRLSIIGHRQRADVSAF